MPYYMHELNPDFNPALGLLQHLTNEELQQLLNDDDRLQGMTKDLPQVKNAEAEREILLASNKSLAEFNLSQEPRLHQSREHLIHLYDEAVQLKQEVEEKKQKLDEITRRTSLETTLALLQTAAAETEEETEALAEEFLKSETAVETFLEQFLEKRKLAHMRRVKAEKMSELLNQTRSQNCYAVPRSRTPVTASRPSSQPIQPPYSYQPITPYPLPSQMGMPMPQFR